jgi:hypothetical protein
MRAPSSEKEIEIGSALQWSAFQPHNPIKLCLTEFNDVETEGTADGFSPKFGGALAQPATRAKLLANSASERFDDAMQATPVQ